MLMAKIENFNIFSRHTCVVHGEACNFYFTSPCPREISWHPISLDSRFYSNSFDSKFTGASLFPSSESLLLLACTLEELEV